MLKLGTHDCRTGALRVQTPAGHRVVTGYFDLVKGPCLSAVNRFQRRIGLGVTPGGSSVEGFHMIDLFSRAGVRLLPCRASVGRL